MRFCADNMLERAKVTAESEFSVTEFPVSRITDRRTSKRWRSYRAPNLMLHGNCDSADAPTLDGTPPAATNGTWALDEDVKYEGTGSWCLTKTNAVGAGNAWVNLHDLLSTTDMHGLSNGKVYEIRFRIRTNAATPSHCGLISYQYYSAAWNVRGSGLCVSANTWEFKTYYDSIIPLTTGIQLYFYIYTDAAPGTKVWIDDIKFYEKNEYVLYGKCEDGYSPTIDNGTFGLVNGTWARTAAQKYAGSYSWVLTKTTASGAGSALVYLCDNANNNDMHGLTAGKTYRLSAAAYYAAGALANISLGIQEYYDGSWKVLKTFRPTSLGAWKYQQETFTINPATTGIFVIVYIASAEAVNSALYIDSFSIQLESRLTIDLYSAYAPQFAAVIGHNLSAYATAYVQANTSASWTAPPVSEEIDVQALMLLYLANATNYRYWSFVFYDNDYSEDGYQEIGWAALGDWLTCQTGPKVDRSRKYDDKSIATELESGAVIGMISTKLESIDYETPPWTKENAAAFDAMYEEVRTVKPFMFVLTEDDLTAVEPIYGRFEQPIERTHDQNTDRYSFKFRIKEAR